MLRTTPANLPNQCALALYRMQKRGEPHYAKHSALSYEASDAEETIRWTYDPKTLLVCDLEVISKRSA